MTKDNKSKTYTETAWAFVEQEIMVHGSLEASLAHTERQMPPEEKPYSEIQEDIGMYYYYTTKGYTFQKNPQVREAARNFAQVILEVQDPSEEQLDELIAHIQKGQE